MRDWNLIADTSISPVLREVDVVGITNQECVQSYSVLTVTSSNICISTAGGKGSCNVCWFAVCYTVNVFEQACSFIGWFWRSFELCQQWCLQPGRCSQLWIEPGMRGWNSGRFLASFQLCWLDLVRHWFGRLKCNRIPPLWSSEHKLIQTQREFICVLRDVLLWVHSSG